MFLSGRVCSFLWKRGVKLNRDQVLFQRNIHFIFVDYSTPNTKILFCLDSLISPGEINMRIKTLMSRSPLAVSRSPVCTAPADARVEV